MPKSLPWDLLQETPYSTALVVESGMKKYCQKKFPPLFWWTYFETIHWLIESTTFIPNSKEEEKSPKSPKIWLFFSKTGSLKVVSAIFKCVTPCCGDDWSTFRHFFTNKPWIYFSEWSSITNIEKTSWLVIKYSYTLRIFGSIQEKTWNSNGIIQSALTWKR